MLYESLSFRFELKSDHVELGRRAAGLIGAFARPLADCSPSVVYSIRSAHGRPPYTLHRDDRQMATSEDASTLIRHLLWLVSNDTVELADGYLLVHAGAVVSRDGDGVLILGESGSGKTTLVAALVQDGFGYLSDEAAAIDLDTGLVHPWPRQLGLWPATRALPRFAALGTGDSDGVRHVPIEEIRSGATADPCRVRLVIDHCYMPGLATRIEPLSRAVALMRIGSAAPRLRLEGDRGLAVLARIMRHADSYSLQGGDLDQSVRAVQAL